jgi:4-aminobutyrate aminotransferase/4-aminobutyrate aminotransferase/(S)-3-amino-2-methylpropionate transaminase
MAKDWWKASARDVPRIVVEPPGPKSKAMHASACRYFHGLSSQVKLFPVCFEQGHGITLTDVDGNRSTLLPWGTPTPRSPRRWPTGPAG